MKNVANGWVWLSLFAGLMAAAAHWSPPTGVYVADLLISAASLGLLVVSWWALMRCWREKGWL